MPAERWSGIDKLLSKALEHPPGERGAFLDEACGSDVNLREEIESLIRAHEAAGDFMASLVSDDQSEPGTGQQRSTPAVGPVVLDRLLGEAVEGGASTMRQKPFDRGGQSLDPGDKRPTMAKETLEKAWPALDLLDENRFSPGTMVADRYRIVSLLGRGGMGEVYRADDLKLRQPVALKFLPEPLARDEATLSRFTDEVKIARQISHPNVCRVYDIGELAGHHFLSMEYIDGEDLASLLRRIGRPTMDKAIEIAQQLCNGLAAVHQESILHRDLKPGNLMVDGQGRLRITDFGLCLHSSSAELAGKLTGIELRRGTPAYMAPEQYAGQTVSIRTELYALGLVLYELFTGQRAFQADSPEELARLHRETAPAPPSSLAELIDPAIERIILRCLEKDPKDRPSSARAVAAALSGGEDSAKSAALKALLLCELIGRTRWTQQLGRNVTKNLSGIHDRIVRRLLEEHEGQEIGKTDPFHQVLFDRPIHAVRYALAYHKALVELSQEEGMELVSRVGIHLGEVSLSAEAEQQRASEASEPERLGPAWETVTELVSLAEGSQTLLTRHAFDLARQSSMAELEGVHWLAHGSYEVQGLTAPLQIFEVGVEGSAPLQRPQDRDKARRQIMQETISGWRPAPDLELPRRRHWVVEKKLSEGGFGEVWLAVHKKTRERRVFKFCYDPERLRALQREITLFRLLKETLGDRDDITRILDWNFDEAPYFIESEYTAGGSLVEWAEEQGDLGEVPLATRLEIVAQVATALAAAHSVGVLHKDVKPRNVLITTDGESQTSSGRLSAGCVRAKLSDFGVGLVTERQRLIDAGITVVGLTEIPTETTPRSSYGGTRLYLAPELLEGKPPTLQADIYALGVMLYQMVVGDFSRALAPGWERNVDDELLVEDIAAAVDGSPKRRLSAALRLAERLRAVESRHQERETRRRKRDEAEQAKAAMARSLKRRRVVALLSATLILFAGILFSSILVQSRHIAREAEATQEVSNFLVDLFKVSDPDAALGNRITAREILDRGAERIKRELRDQPQIQARLMHTIGVVYQSLGLYDAAVPLIEEALETRRQIHRDQHVEVADSLSALADVLKDKGEYERAEELSLESLVLRRRLLGEQHPDVAESLTVLAYVLNFKGDYEGAERLFRQSLAMRQRLLGNEHLDVAASLRSLAALLMDKGDYKGAEPYYRESLAMRQRLLGDEHPDVAEGLNSLAFLLHSKGDDKGAEQIYRRSLAMRRRLLGDEHPSVAHTLNNLALLLYANGNYEEAESLLRESLEMHRRLLGVEHPYVAAGLSHLAYILHSMGDFIGAEKLFRDSLDMNLRLSGEDHPDVAANQQNLAFLLRSKGDYEAAEKLYLESWATLRRLWGEETNRDVARSVHGLAVVLHLKGDLKAAEPLLRESLGMYRLLLGEEHPTVAAAMSSLADLLIAKGEVMDAERLIRQALEILNNMLPMEDWRISKSEGVLGTFLTEAGHYEDAERILLNSYSTLKEQKGEQSHYTQSILRRIIKLYEAWGKSGKTAEYRALLVVPNPSTP